MAIGQKMSEFPKYETEIVSLLKFTEHVDSLLKGDLYMNNLQRYIDMEKESGKRGMGDKLEGAQVWADMEVRIYDNETGELLLQGDSELVHARLQDAEKTPVYCLFALTTDHLTLVDETDEFYIAKVDFSDEEKEKMIKEFGETIVMIGPSAFAERVQKAFNEKGYGYRMGKINYDDYGVNSAKRMQAFAGSDSEFFFWKDKFFENQNEYRIAIKSIKTDKAITENIGDISDIANVISAEKFFGDELRVYLRK
ncbi:hypothetical protein O0Q50_30585 [Priestia aryabhattai]|uniref:DUF4868 domain-containing protein n=1 Tax=Priestia aryabhattai TaxID=412384 RepID=A0AAX6NI75_PRIAR|nr:hypothetical protein [Priestia aryabhattai]MDU9695552.1 hypothetical protein [Priestia aryabhattai]